MGLLNSSITITKGGQACYFITSDIGFVSSLCSLS